MIKYVIKLLRTVGELLLQNADCVNPWRAGQAIEESHAGGVFRGGYKSIHLIIL